MSDWIKDNPVLAWVIGFALGLVVTLTVCKFYIDYRVENKYETKLEKIENQLDTLIVIMRNNYE